ncbi:TadE/TadG family type IV pilus assembly protein [Aureimonas pseudogalii]|uniref:Flp pilus assembly protein TadG n=1 Tax=Aureimonas pseudogalii TaxID=1744844 RepID=A0A7W6ECM9_9HYPH|nr:TadE/TadG family type IV pilus assembly protein [Aureimonas pseudogalii]MBB3997586.1 Flp pilus assembly protein TadG [Aureimonas pseudogalii]
MAARSRSPSGPSPSRRPCALRRLCGERRGSVALEFAIVAPIFLAIVFSTLEAGWMMTQATLLDRALDITVREVRIGGPDAPTTEPQIRKAVCDRAMVIPGCEAVATVEMRLVEKASDFPTAAATCVDRGTTARPVTSFQSAARAKITFVRVCIVVDPITPLMGLALQLPKDAKGGYRLATSSAFLSEPGT